MRISDWSSDVCSSDLPLGFIEDFAALHDCSRIEPAAVFVQDVTRIGHAILGRKAQPVTDLAGCDAKAVLVVAFDARRLIDQIRNLLPAGAEVLSLHAMRPDDSILTNRRNQIHPSN